MAQVIYNKHTKDTFQAAISRGNPNLVTPVELDFSLPRNIALAQQCQVLLNWETSYKTLSRQSSTMHHSSTHMHMPFHACSGIAANLVPIA